MRSPPVIDERSARWIATAYVLLVLVFEIYIVGVEYAPYFAYLVDDESREFALLTIVCFLLSIWLFYLFVRNTLLASWAFRTVSLALLAVALIVEYGYEKALGRFSNVEDLQTAIATTPEQKIAGIAMYLNTKALVPLLVLFGLSLVTRPKEPRGLKHTFVSLLLVIVAFAVFPLVVAEPFPVPGFIAAFRTGTDLLIITPATRTIAGEADLHRRPIPTPPRPRDSRPSNNVVVIVDESVMGDHFSLNGYARETTPFLDDLARRKLLSNWKIATSASTGSRFTYAALITGLTPDDFPDRSKVKVRSWPTLFQYAKAMGYSTWFFDGQMNAYWGDSSDDTNYIDHWNGVLDVSAHKSFATWDLDNQIAKNVGGVISDSTGNFIFIFKHGSHIPYGSDFPPDQAVWTPSYEAANEFDIPGRDVLPSVVNAYDNSIKYNVNTFFENLIPDYTKIPNNTVIIYTGDHGQTLFVNGRSSHGGNTKAEATVPLLMIGSLPSGVDTAYKASHANIFPTVLDLLGYPQELRGSGHFLSLLRARSTDTKPRYFNPDLGPKVLFDQ